MQTYSPSETDKDILSELYATTKKTVDDLPYTDEFELLFAEFVLRTGKKPTLHQFWRALSNARKGSRLIRKER